MLKKQSNNQSNQPQYPHQAIHTEKLLKETSTNNSIDYTIMDASQQIFKFYFIIQKGRDIETEWRRTQETQDWRQDLQL